MRNSDRINSIIIDDIDKFEKEKNRYLPEMLRTLFSFVRQDEIPDYHIIDINAMIGCYLDEAEYFEDKDTFIMTKKIFFRCYENYMSLCFALNELEIYRNFLKLKLYSGDDAIFVK